MQNFGVFVLLLIVTFFRRGQDGEEENDDHVFRDRLNRTCIAVILAGGSGSPENPLSNSRSLAAMEVVNALAYNSTRAEQCVAHWNLF